VILICAACKARLWLEWGKTFIFHDCPREREFWGMP